MVKRKKEKNYEQLSIFEFFSTELETDYNKNAEREESSSILRTTIEEQTIGFNSTTGRRNIDTVSDDNQRTISKESKHVKSNISTKSYLYGNDRKTSERIDNGMDSETEAIPIQENNFFYLDNELEQKLSIKRKYERNIKAIKLLDVLKKEDRTATFEEKKILAGYTGWGGCSQIFDENNLDWKEQRKILKNLITIKEYNNARASTLTSFYTPYVIIDNMYKIIDKLGFKYGNILEPSCGIGNFIGRMPREMIEESYVAGVEIDTITGNIAKYLYDRNDINIAGFEDTHFPDNCFDLVITNVPFGNFKVYDKKYHKLNFNIHNYFIAKSLDLVHDGGIVAVITSTETLDGNSNIRKYINEHANFIGAIRLPSNTFYINGANTQVTSDIIFLQKIENKIISHSEEYLSTSKINEQFHRKINNYFINNPDMVFGNVVERKNQYGKYEIEVIDDPIVLLDLENVTENSINTKKFEFLFSKIINKFSNIFYSNEEITNISNLEIKDINKYAPNSYFIENEKIYYKSMENITEVDNLKIKDQERLSGLIRIAEITNEVIKAQVNNIDNDKYVDKRNTLNKLYDEFILKYGYIYTLSNSRLFKEDYRFSLVRALEDVDIENKTAKKEKIFFEKTIYPVEELKVADSLESAISASYNNFGKIDIDYICTIYNKNSDTVKKELLEKRLAFIEPDTEKLVGSNDYLSGNIRKKLKIAKHYNAETNIEALSGVLPPLIESEDITIQMGANWIDDEIMHEFIKYLFKPASYQTFDINYDKNLGIWIIDKYYTYNDPEIDNNWNVESTDNSTIIGSDNKEHIISQPVYNGWNLIEDIINSKTISIYDYWSEYTDEKEIRKRKLNIERTTTAKNLAEQLEEKFKEWIFEDIDRRNYLTEKYNDIFNSIRLKEYDGSYLTFPDMNSSILLEDYQKNAIARIIDSKNTLLSQRVGAGKTFEMIAAGMKMKQMGLRHKLLYVVPNHLVQQWGQDFMKLYPHANILVADNKDFTKDKRQLFIHKIATSNYDAIIMAHSSFGLIPMSLEFQTNAMQNEIEKLQNAIDELNLDINFKYNKGQKKRVKQLERTKKSIENNIKTLIESKHRDQGITFDQLGIDYMFVDEAHEFKNLYIYSARSNIAGIPSAKSKKASDMLMKCQWIQKNGGNICFATGTPISNTMAELYVLQKYLQNDQLEEMGIYCFDSWAKNFGEVVTSFEISIDGKGFTSKERFSKFFNIQELITVFKDIAEIQTESMLNNALRNSKTGRKFSIPPTHIGGKPQIISIEPSLLLKSYIDNIAKRADAVHNNSVDRSVDNMLKITTDSKKASIDLRLIDEELIPYETTKLEVIADNISKLYFQYANDKATQLVFCDSSTPNKNKFNVYDELKRLMMINHIPENEIAYIHDYNTMKAKQKLFDKVNKGDIRILMGSTAKLGAGTNVQERLIALHHVDVPWRSSDIEQRNGRAFRQGNRYDKIYEFRYVTKRSFDAYSWQMIETKASYQAQLFEGTTSTREIAEDNKAIFSYSEIKAIASDNPLIKRKFEVDNAIKKIETIQKQWQKRYFNSQKQIQDLPSKIEYLENIIPSYKNDKSLAELSSISLENLNSNFFITYFGKRYTDIKTANDVLLDYLDKNKSTASNLSVGCFCGFDIILKYDKENGWIIYLKAENEYKVDILNRIGRTNIERMLKRMNSISNTVINMTTNLTNLKENLQIAKKVVSEPFPQKEELKKLKTEQKEINSKLTNTEDKFIGGEQVLEN